MTPWLVAVGILLAGSVPVGRALQRARRDVDETVESFEAFREALSPAVSQVQEESGHLRAGWRRLQRRAKDARGTLHFDR